MRQRNKEEIRESVNDARGEREREKEGKNITGIEEKRKNKN